MGRETEREGRQANYELLRIIAMFMVVTLHYLNHTGMLLTAGGEGGGARFLGMLVESFCIVAVNVYVMISGYFLVEAGFKVKRIVTLVCQVLFYAVMIPLIMMGPAWRWEAGRAGFTDCNSTCFRYSQSIIGLRRLTYICIYLLRY